MIFQKLLSEQCKRKIILVKVITDGKEIFRQLGGEMKMLPESFPPWQKK